MFSLIIRKEILNNLLNARFLGACAISIVIIISSVMVLTGTYHGRLQDYRNRIVTQDDFVDQYGHLNRAGWMVRPLRGPARYGPLVLGIDHETAEENFAANPLPVLFPRLDLVTIVTVMMSLMAILFSYNTLSGEREAGLLKQMLSTATARSTIVLGKFIGGSLSLIAPFTIGVLGGLVYIAAQPDFQLATVDLLVFFMLLCLSYLYISVFYGLGLLFSARSQSSSVAVLKSLFAWVIFVLVLPNISPFLAAQIYRIPSKAKIDQQVWTLRGEERDRILNERTRELLRTKYSDIAGTVVGLSRMVGEGGSDLQKKTGSDPVFRERYNEYRREWLRMVDQVNEEQRVRAAKITREFNERSEYQEKLATMFASISPVANYVFAATDLTETGIHAENSWRRQVESYYASLDPYLKAKYEREMERNPTLTVNDYIDLSDRPHFQYRPAGISEKVELILLRAGILFCFNALFFAAAMVSFLKYDVR
jgi:ABC-type transport system involved in multi-copper enzyme maturation permease subunit